MEVFLMKRSLFLVVAALVCLSLTGIAYAAWSENITIEGYVTAGSFDIKWSDAQLDRAGEPQFEGDYVATVTLNDNDENKLVYTVINAYPGWESGIRCKVTNAGSIPAKLKVDLVDVPGVLDVEFLREAPATLDARTTTEEIVIKVSVPEEVDAEFVQAQQYQFMITITGTQFNIED
jgi:predicted ribosomally synthesized peptide with SipW-like signal peptide